MTTATETGVTTQVNRIYIKATAQAVWDAITKPEWTARYGYGGLQEFDLRPGAPTGVRERRHEAARQGARLRGPGQRGGEGSRPIRLAGSSTRSGC